MICCGGQALPVFSGEDEADLFAWLGGALEEGWWARETSVGELISTLYGPCAHVRGVALDPSPGMAVEEIGLVSVSPERFLDWVAPPGHRGSAGLAGQSARRTNRTGRIGRRTP